MAAAGPAAFAGAAVVGRLIGLADLRVALGAVAGLAVALALAATVAPWPARPRPAPHSPTALRVE